MYLAKITCKYVLDTNNIRTCSYMILTCQTQAQLLAIVDTLAIFGVSWKLFPQYIKDLHIHTIGARNKQ